MTRESPGRRRAQSTAEYAILIGIIIAAAIAMQAYVKRGMQGRVFDASNKFYNTFTGDSELATINPTVSPPKTNQYEPQTLSSQSTQTTLNANETLTMGQGGKVTRGSYRRTTQQAGDYQQQSYP